MERVTRTFLGCRFDASSSDSPETEASVFTGHNQLVKRIFSLTEIIVLSRTSDRGYICEALEHFSVLNIVPV